MTIWKYELNGGQIDVDMPEGAQLLCVQAQRNVLCLWAKVHPENKKEKRRFTLCGTGNSMRAGSTYIGSAQLGIFVWHVFEELIGRPENEPSD